MSRPGMVIPVTVLVMMMVVGVTPATTPAADCNAATASLSPCFEYVTGTGATPPKECCSGLSTLNANSPSCLCQLITQLNGSSSAASSVNITKGLSLPKDCSITLVTTNCPGKNVFRSSTSWFRSFLPASVMRQCPGVMQRLFQILMLWTVLFRSVYRSCWLNFCQYDKPNYVCMAGMSSMLSDVAHFCTSSFVCEFVAHQLRDDIVISLPIDEKLLARFLSRGWVASGSLT